MRLLLNFVFFRKDTWRFAECSMFANFIKFPEISETESCIHSISLFNPGAPASADSWASGGRGACRGPRVRSLAQRLLRSASTLREYAEIRAMCRRNVICLKRRRGVSEQEETRKYSFFSQRMKILVRYLRSTRAAPDHAKTTSLLFLSSVRFCVGLLLNFTDFTKSLLTLILTRWERKS